LRSALEESDQIAQLVEGLLLLARADAGMLRMDRKPVDLVHLVTEIYAQTQVLADAHKISLHLGTVEPVVIQGDADRLRRLLLNLVDNAIKYTPSGGQVTLSLTQQGDRAALQVSDTGIGLSPEEQERIFQRFYRAPEARTRNERGTGLGLCIAQSIAEAHGGRILVKSTPGQGSTFTVFLPLHA
jgi:signal transduction histidine kinase